MTRLRTVGCVVLLLVPTLARSDGPALRYHLRSMLGSDGDIDYFGSSSIVLAKKPKVALTREPSYRSEAPLYATVKFGKGDDNRYAFVFDESRGTGAGYDLLYVDVDNDKDLAEHEPIHSLHTMGSSYYGPARVLVLHDGFRSVHHLFVRSYRGVAQSYVSSTCYYSGEVTIAGAKRRIAVIDGNCNGLYNEFAKDRVAIDLDDDGKFDASWEKGEVLPQGKYVRVGDTFYSVQISDDGAEAEVVEPKTATGRVRVTQTNVWVALNSEVNGYLAFSTEDGRTVLPVGRYGVSQIQLTAEDSAGGELKATGSVRTKEKPLLEVSDEREAVLHIGSPFTTSVVADVDGYGVRLSLSMKGAAGEQYSSYTMNGSRPPEPTLVITDDKGNEVLSTNFEYG